MSGNDKFNGWREVTIIEKEHICNNFKIAVLFLLLIFEQVNTSWEGRVRSNVYVIFISSLLVRLFRFSVFRVGFFSTYQFISDTTLFSVKISRQTYKTKTQFSRSDFDVINRHYFIKVITATNFNFML